MVPGVFSSDAGIIGTRRGDFASAVLMAAPTGDTGLFALSAGMKRQDAKDTTVTWFEEEFFTGRINITNNAGTGATITVDEVGGVIVGQIYYIESTGERVYVTAINGNDLTVQRGFGELQSAQAVNGSVTPVGFQLLGTAFEEGSSRPPAISYVGHPVWNHCMIQRHAWDYTGTAKAVDWHTGDQIAKNRRDASNDHALAWERLAWFSTRGYGHKNGQPFRTMGGVLEMIKTNVHSQTSNTKWDDIDAFLEAVYKWNVKGMPNERIFFAGDTVLRTLNKLARLEGNMELVAGQTEFGLKVMRWITPWGDMALMRHPLFSINPVWTKMLVALHPGALVWKYLRDTMIDAYDKSGSRNGGVDGEFGVITTELTIQLLVEKTCGVYTGIDTAAATS